MGRPRKVEQNSNSILYKVLKDDDIGEPFSDNTFDPGAPFDEGSAELETSATFESLRPELERLAVQTYIDIMTDHTLPAKDRKETADSVMKALGKDAPPKATSQPIVLAFGEGMKKALSGIGQMMELRDKND